MRVTRASLEQTVLDHCSTLQYLLAPDEPGTGALAGLLAGLPLADLRAVAAAHAILARAAASLDPPPRPDDEGGTPA